MFLKSRRVNKSWLQLCPGRIIGDSVYTTLVPGPPGTCSSRSPPPPPWCSWWRWWWPPAQTWGGLVSPTSCLVWRSDSPCERVWRNTDPNCMIKQDKIIRSISFIRYKKVRLKKSDAWWMMNDEWCLMHNAWWYMMRSESSNYKLGHLDKKLFQLTFGFPNTPNFSPFWNIGYIWIFWECSCRENELVQKFTFRYSNRTPLIVVS